MGHQKSLFLFLFFFFFVYLSTLVFASDFRCYEMGNYTTNSTYSTNLNNLLSSLTSNMGVTGFYSASLGQSLDRVNALAMCRTDISLDSCRSCIQDASSNVVSSCPNRKQAVLWIDKCMVRYSNEIFFGKVNYDGYRYILKNTFNVTSSPDQFKEDLGLLIQGLVNQTASGGPQLKVAAGDVTAPGFMRIYSLLQCTPDISEQDCLGCLTGCAGVLTSCCNNSIGVRVYTPSCTFRYEVNDPFYDKTRLEEVKRLVSVSAPAPDSVPQVTPPQPAGNNDNNKSRTIFIIVVPILSSLILFACLGAWLARRRKKTAKGVADVESADDNEISTDQESMHYDFNKIREATNDFAIANKLGEGGFGVVYKGVLQDGQEIAVKRLVKGSSQGDLEFRNEVMLLAKLQHRNLVRLVGFAQEGKERILVYEFIQNGSLDCFIFDQTKCHSMDWNRRLKIIVGIARGLLYLHEDSRLRVIHRDLKPSNILLDANMNPKIADFGTARLCEREDSTIVSTSKIAGTRGYMAPEYVMRGQFSIKSDVFSFGVLVLEIISGQRNGSYFEIGNTDTIGEGLQRFAVQNWHKGTITRVIDPILRSTPGCLSEITRCIHIALLCIEEKASDRPTMASVVLMLSSSTVTLPGPSNLSFSDQSVNASLPSTNDSGDVESTKLPDAKLAYDVESTKSPDAKLAYPLPNDESLITEIHPR